MDWASNSCHFNRHSVDRRAGTKAAVAETTWISAVLHLIRWFQTSSLLRRVPASGMRASRRQIFNANTPVTYNDQSLGIEQLVANEIIVPPGGNPVLASWDRPFFYINNVNAYPSSYGPVDSSAISLRVGLSIMPRRTRIFLSGSPIGGARRNRAIQPMAARPGRLLPPKSREPARSSLAERSRPVRRQTSYGRRRMDFSRIIPQMAVRLGILSYCPASPAGPALIGRITSIPGPSQLTAYSQIPSTCLMQVRGCSPPPMAARPGQRHLAAI